MCLSYNVARNTKRWSVVLFYHMLNIAGINAQIVYNSNVPDNKLLRRNFLRQIINSLVEPHLHSRAHLQNFPRSLKCRLEEICDIESHQDENIISGRRFYYGSKKNRKTRFACFKCHKHMCLEHITAICRKTRNFKNNGSRVLNHSNFVFMLMPICILLLVFNVSLV